MQGELFNEEVDEELRLKNFMENNFDYATFKKVGLYPPEVKKSDYKEQAKIICNRLGLKSIYEYLRDPFWCHISYADSKPGKDIARHHPFIERIGGLETVKDLAKIIPFKQNDESSSS